MLSKPLNQFSVEGWGWVPSLSFDLRLNYGGGNEDNGHFLQKVLCMHCLVSAPNPAAGHHRPIPPPETPGHSQASLGQSLVGSLLLSPGSWFIQGFVCALQESVSPVLCKFWRFYGGVNGDHLQEGLCHIQIWCTQNLCPCGRPLVTRTSTGDTQTLKGSSGSDSVGSPGVRKFGLSPPSISGRHGA